MPSEEMYDKASPASWQENPHRDVLGIENYQDIYTRELPADVGLRASTGSCRVIGSSTDPCTCVHTTIPYYNN